MTGGPGILSRVATGGPAPSGLVAAVVAGRPLSELATGLGLTPAALVATLAAAALGSDGASAPALTRSRPRASGLATPLSAAGLASLFPRAGRPALLALSAGLLQAFDYWEESHGAAQQADDQGERAVSAYWHGVAHRREPDAGNAAYWFRRVGKHPVFERLADAARERAAVADGGAVRRALRGDEWDPYGFIDLCTRAKPSDIGPARDLQRVEMALLLDASLPAESSSRAGGA